MIITCDHRDLDVTDSPITLAMTMSLVLYAFLYKLQALQWQLKQYDEVLYIGKIIKMQEQFAVQTILLTL